MWLDFDHWCGSLSVVVVIVNISETWRLWYDCMHVRVWWLIWVLPLRPFAIIVLMLWLGMIKLLTCLVTMLVVRPWCRFVRWSKLWFIVLSIPWTRCWLSFDVTDMAGYDIGRKTLVLDLVCHDMALSPHCGLVMTWHWAHTAVYSVSNMDGMHLYDNPYCGLVMTWYWAHTAVYSVSDMDRTGLDICPLHRPRCDLPCDYLPGTWLPLKYSVYNMDWTHCL